MVNQGADRKYIRDNTAPKKPEKYYDKQALILVNESAKRFSDLWLMVEHIIKVVDQKYGILLEPEPEII